MCAYGPNYSWFDNLTENLIKIDAWTLSESPLNPSGLIMIKRAISKKLVSKDPHVGVARATKHVKVCIGWLGRV